MSKLIFLPALVLALFIGSLVARPTSDAGAATDIRVLFQAQTDAINKGDLDGVMALYADDALVTGNAVCTTPCKGKAPIRVAIALQISQHAKFTIISLQEPSAGNGVGRVRVEADAIKLCGQQRVEADFTVKVADKITTLDTQFDLRDPQTAAFLRCFAALNAPAAARPVVSPPSTGDAGLLAE